MHFPGAYAVPFPSAMSITRILPRSRGAPATGGMIPRDDDGDGAEAHAVHAMTRGIARARVRIEIVMRESMACCLSSVASSARQGRAQSRHGAQSLPS